MWTVLAANWTSALVVLLVLACPFMHVFGHGHRHQSRHGHDGGER
jgi:hypothetical protein